ncbi:hypothetical protein RAE06_06000 [Corynebacterium tuberculostearicum]|uniref:hypothetical protein n=1 Tax=Corynebacterium tuberculostearicum TaxID=38304 RepID=UPI00265D0518|nr:hypothetical protein [Corynebacterium tuberculostearicum]MDV2428448.1 hypothetical protein [Corynebacterium tuberculostearicum]WKE54952.1 hypothetical protein J8245_10070 [Corynebacterium tuberculostearicum]
MRDASFERGKRRKGRRTREARPRREHWSREYAIYAEDSWGIDDLGPEGGENSVRAYSGGRADGNRRQRR